MIGARPTSRSARGGSLLALPAGSRWARIAPRPRADDSSAPTYERDIKPLFAKRCTVCHRASKRDDPDISGGLALDSFEAVLAGTTREKVIVPGRRPRASWCAGWPTRTRIGGCRSRTSRCRSRSKSWCGAGSTREHRGECPSSGRGGTERRALSPGRIGCGRVRSLDVVLPTDVKLAPGP